MSLSDAKCAYHPDKDAITICTICQRYICRDDRRIYKKKIYKTFSRYVEISKQDYCVLCYSNQLATDLNKTPKGIAIFSAIIILPGIMIGLVVGNIILVIYWLVPAGVVVLLVIAASYDSYSNLKIKLKIAEQDNKRFERSQKDKTLPFNTKKIVSNELDKPKQTGISEINEKHRKESTLLMCYKCGTEIFSKDKYCPNCGNRINV
ncbi:MAG: hypothetical protein ACFFD1_11945 [Candidatus Thorarchaeota archaeon]